MAALARRQHGVVTRAQLRELGMSGDAIDRAARSGWLHRIHRGVFAVGHTALSQEGRWMAAVLAAGEGAVLSHRSAAHLWRLTTRSPALTDITTPRTKKPIKGITVHRTRRLAPQDVTQRHGIACTTVARTLTDLAEVASTNETRKAIHQAEILYGVTPSPINGRRGTPRLDERPDRSRSELERAFLTPCERARLPTPLHNVDVEGAERDFVWPDQRLVVELDGWETHRTRFAFENDRARDQALARKRWRVVRFTWRQVTEQPASVVVTLRAALASAA